jgi:hypothetical protein
MEPLKLFFQNHVEKLVLGLAGVLLLAQIMGAMGSKGDEQKKQQVQADIARLKQMHAKSKPEADPPLTYAARAGTLWARLALQGTLNQERMWPPDEIEPTDLPRWTLLIKQKGRYAMPKDRLAKSILNQPRLGDLQVAIADEGRALVTLGGATEGETRVTLVDMKGNTAIVPIQINKRIPKLHPPRLLGAHAGVQMGVTLCWQDAPNQHLELPVDTYRLYRMGPLKAPGGTGPERSRTVSKRERLLARRASDWEGLRVVRGAEGGDRMYYFDRNVKPDSLYAYWVASEAMIQEETKTVPSARRMTVRTPRGAHVYPVATAISGTIKSASIVVLKWVDGRWVDYNHRGVWIKGCPIPLSKKKATGVIGKRVRLDGEKVDLRTPFVLVDVDYDEITYTTKDGRSAKTRIPKIIYKDKEGFQYDRRRMTLAQAKAEIARITEAGAWDAVEAGPVAPSMPERTEAPVRKPERPRTPARRPAVRLPPRGKPLDERALERLTPAQIEMLRREGRIPAGGR